MEFITVEQFKEQSIEVQKVFLDWWKVNRTDADLVLLKTGKDKLKLQIVSNIDMICTEDDEFTPLFTEGQLRKFIEDKTNTKIETSLTVYKQYALWLVKVKGEDYETFDTKEEELLQAYWKVACMIAKEEVNG